MFIIMGEEAALHTIALVLGSWDQARLDPGFEEEVGLNIFLQ